MRVAKEANWYLIFKVRCPHCLLDHEVSHTGEYGLCTTIDKKFKLGPDVLKLRQQVDDHLNKPYPPAVIRKNEA